MKIKSKYNIGDAFYLPSCIREDVVETIIRDGKEYHNCSEVYVPLAALMKIDHIEFEVIENYTPRIMIGYVDNELNYLATDESELKFYTSDQAFKIAQEYADKKIEYLYTGEL